MIKNVILSQFAFIFCFPLFLFLQNNFFVNLMPIVASTCQGFMFLQLWISSLKMKLAKVTSNLCCVCKQLVLKSLLYSSQIASIVNESVWKCTCVVLLKTSLWFYGNISWARKEVFIEVQLTVSTRLHYENTKHPSENVSGKERKGVTKCSWSHFKALYEPHMDSERLLIKLLMCVFPIHTSTTTRALNS